MGEHKEIRQRQFTVQKFYVPVHGFLPFQKYQIVASFNGAEGLDAKIDPIDMRPVRNLDRLEQKFMRQTLDYRKGVFWTDGNGTLFDT